VPISAAALATKDEKRVAQRSMINGQFSMGERYATRNTQHALEWGFQGYVI